ncbi:MAG: response regulator transcription factor [Actinomycetia bacterium]|nr:response regulator transcription factor [Actinomycetes bacterium]
MNDTNTNGPSALIAEDDREIREALERILRSEGYATFTANDGAAALEAVTEHAPDVIVLDVMMPFVDGLAVCRHLREKGNQTPILMLTARHELRDRVEGLDAGADDYLAKPFELEELLARLRALLRRAVDSDDVILTTGPISLDVRRRLVQANGLEVELTRTEFSLLELLMRNEDIVLERSTIYDRVWGYDFGTASRSLDVHIGYLRRKLEAMDLPRMIETVRGVGFVIRQPNSD